MVMLLTSSSPILRYSGVNIRGHRPCTPWLAMHGLNNNVANTCSAKDAITDLQLLVLLFLKSQEGHICINLFKLHSSIRILAL